MSTRSHIGILNTSSRRNPKSTEIIYCHFDGYPSHNGSLLLNHWIGAKKVRALMAIGDISSLDEEIGEKHDFDNRDGKVVTAYGRDRGETRIHSQKFGTFETMCLSLKDTWAEYIYMYDVKHACWRWTKLYQKQGKFLHLKKLTQKDCGKTS